MNFSRPHSRRLICLLLGGGLSLGISVSACSVSILEKNGELQTPSETRLPSPDITAPTISINPLGLVTASNQSLFPMDGTCEGAEDGRPIQIRIAGLALTTTPASIECFLGLWSGNADLSSEPEGNLTLTADVSDLAGNPAVQATQSITKDSLLPTLTITWPEEGTVANSADYPAFAIAGTCSEEGSNVELSFAFSTANIPCTNGIWKAALDLIPLPDGPFSFVAKQIDSATNEGLSPTRVYSKSASAPMQVYRSVGPFKTLPLSKGAQAGLLEVSGPFASFATALPLNVGMGDVLLYDADGVGGQESLAFIYGRISSTLYSVRLSTPGNPSPTLAPTTQWTLYRAYASLKQALAGNENPSIGVNFDPFPGSKDLSAANKVWNLALFNDGIDLDSVTISSWTTDLTHYLRLYTPTGPFEVGESQRHNGTWGTGYQRVAALNVAIPNLRLEGISIRQENDDGLFIIQNITGPGEIAISHSFGHHSHLTTNWDVFSLINLIDLKIKLWNNIAINQSAAGSSTAFYLNTNNNAFAYLYNNTAMVSGGIAYSNVGGTAHFLKNNLAHISGAGSGFNAGVAFAAFDNNASSDGSALGKGGSGNRGNQTITFRDRPQDDLHLAASDTSSRGMGINLSGDSNLPFSTDLDNTTRPATWDIGADQQTTLSGSAGNHPLFVSLPDMGDDLIADLSYKITVEIRDSNNALVSTGPDSTALISLSHRGNGVLTGTTAMNAVGGIANFSGKNLKFQLPGDHILTATKEATGASGISSWNSPAFQLSSPPLSRIDLLAGPASSAGHADGLFMSAKVRTPKQMAQVGSNYLLADQGTHTIRSIDPSLESITTIAGSPFLRGFTNGNGAVARFNSPSGVAYVPAVGLFVADRDNCAIRKIDAVQEVTTLIGTPTDCSQVDSPTAANVRIERPTYLTYLGGFLYATDSADYYPSIRKIDPLTGATTTLAGGLANGYVNGIGSAAQFRGDLHGIHNDGTYLYVSDRLSNRVRKIDPTTAEVTDYMAGAASTVFGIGGDANIFFQLSSDALYSFNASTLAPLFQYGQTWIGGFTDGLTTSALFYDPDQVHYDVAAASVIISDSPNHSLRKIELTDANGKINQVTTLIGTPGASVGTAQGIGSAARFSHIRGGTSDGTDVYVLDYNGRAVRKIEKATAQTSLLAGGTFGSNDGIGAAAQFRYLKGITYDGKHLYLIDANAIRKIDIPTQTVTTFAGQVEQSGTTDGVGTAARFSDPIAITTDGKYLYLSDHVSIRMVEIETAEVTTLIGNSAGSCADGFSGGAGMGWDMGRIAYLDGKIYFSDSRCGTLRSLDIASGELTTVAGLANTPGYIDAVGTAARFGTYTLPAIASDGFGIAITDNYNGAIRYYTPSTGAVSTITGGFYQGDVDGVLGPSTTVNDTYGIYYGYGFGLITSVINVRIAH